MTQADCARCASPCGGLGACEEEGPIIRFDHLDGGRLDMGDWEEDE